MGNDPRCVPRAQPAGTPTYDGVGTPDASASSSMAEYRTFNPRDLGSTPRGRTQRRPASTVGLVTRIQRLHLVVAQQWWQWVAQ